MRPAIAIFLCLVGLSMLAAEPLHVELDKLIAAKAVGPIAPRSDDAEFFRRVKLDLNGQVPSVSETRVFLKDTSAKKRSKLIDELLTVASSYHDLFFWVVENILQ